MYDLPCEVSGEPGLPDEFHDLQPQLLSRTLRLRDYAADQYFTGSDINLYYDPSHPRWHKRPDWFLVVDVPRLYRQQDLRTSYVVWDEGKAPTVIVELLSPGREQEDLKDYADEVRSAEQPADLLPYTLEADDSGVAPPHKWDVYEQILQVPYYLVFSRYTNRLRFFERIDGRYHEQELGSETPMAWLPELQLGLGIWHGEFEGVSRAWLRWCDEAGNWLLTDTEQAEQRAERLAAYLRAQGLDPDNLPE
ncbi:MAG TPA: Uma2 family endonuclease [Leptolyngbyaceae cyanobacterium M65_K2018_010]|nr:Uma2 family endonuclease [Leptolyngbyaceae cyanobacterium M65_K2018_010]